jgi:hypothetical protein
VTNRKHVLRSQAAEQVWDEEVEAHPLPAGARNGGNRSADPNSAAERALSIGLSSPLSRRLLFSLSGSVNLRDGANAPHRDSCAFPDDVAIPWKPSEGSTVLISSLHGCFDTEKRQLNYPLN